ncbi:YCF48-related protein [Chitinispirillales bacterium ANBcel5]|uniref:YCF48-related protein n=1 Tax=Cellulosispirillum alkaliphilum TaxID=3039283 RepID=UPI002A56E911|nr:YCF48-related protein [Chitinispirillales bacterium ANBcel5]
MRKVYCFVFLLLGLTLNGYSFESTIQLRHTSFNMRSASFINRDTAFASANPSWNQDSLRYTGTIARTFDGGQTWEKLEVGVHVSFPDLFITDDHTIHVAGTNGRYLRSTDMGERWTVSVMNPRYDFSSIHFTEQNGWLIANRREHTGGGGVALWHTDDGGISWNQLDFPGTASQINDLFFVDDSTGWAAGKMITTDGNSIGAVYLTVDGGESWELMLETEEQVSFTAVSAVDNHAWVAAKRPSSEPRSTVYSTENLGEDWREHSLQANFNAIGFLDTQRGYVAGPRIRGGQPKIYRTTDGGNNWTRVLVDRQTGEEINAIYVTQDFVACVGERDFFTVADDPWKQPIAAEETLFESFQVNPQYVYDAVYFVDENTGWVSGTKTDFDHGNQIILNTTDGGETWQEVYERDTFCVGYGRPFSRLRDLVVVNDSSAVAVGGLGSHWCDPNSSYLVHLDTSGSWVANTHYQGEQMYSIHAISEDNMWALPQMSRGDRLTLVHITEGGANSTLRQYDITVPSSITNGSVFFLDSLNGWVTGGRDFLAATEDGGETWHRNDNNTLSGLLHTVYFITEDIGWVAGDNLYQTTDGGETWEVQILSTSDTDTLNFPIYDITFTDSSHGWLSGGGGIIMQTTDGGETWRGETGRQNFQVLHSISFVNERVGWGCGGGGTIVKIRASGQTVSTQPQITKRNRIHNNHLSSLLTTSNSVIMNFEVHQSTTVQIDLMDLRGRRVTTLKEKLSPQNNRVSLNTQTISPGMYILRYSVQGVSANRSIMIR